MQNVINLRDKSRTAITIKKEVGASMSFDEVTLGCVLRIADSCELMAKDRTELERQNKQLGELASNRYEEIQTLKKAVAAYKGKWNKLKKQLAEMEAKCI